MWEPEDSKQAQFRSRSCPLVLDRGRQFYFSKCLLLVAPKDEAARQLTRKCTHVLNSSIHSFVPRVTDPTPKKVKGSGTLWAIPWFCWLNSHMILGNYYATFKILATQMCTLILAVNVSDHKPTIWLVVQDHELSMSARPFPPLGGEVWEQGACNIYACMHAIQKFNTHVKYSYIINTHVQGVSEWSELTPCNIILSLWTTFRNLVTVLLN